MTTHNLSRIVDASGDNWDIKAKALEAQITIATTGDVTGSATSDLSGNVSIGQTIGTGAVTTSKIADSNVTTAKIADNNVTLDKLASSVMSGSVADNDGKLATHAAVKAAIDTAISGQGAYLGKQTVATINSWIATNLHNGDRAICSDSGTLTLGNLPVRAGEDVIFWKNGSTAVWQSMDGEFKLKQTAKSDPSASGSTLYAIDSITQDANGEITATKKTIQDATTSQKGVMKVGTGLSVSSATVSVSYGTAAGTACQGNDSRLSDSRTPKSHTHGNIQNGGTLQTNDITIASGDKLVVTDSSDSAKIARTSISFDGSTTTQALTKKGTWESFAKAADITSAINALDVSSVGGSGKYISSISQTDGKISAVVTTMDTTPNLHSSYAITSSGVKTYVDGKYNLRASLQAAGNIDELTGGTDGADNGSHTLYYLIAHTGDASLDCTGTLPSNLPSEICLMSLEVVNLTDGGLGLFEQTLKVCSTDSSLAPTGVYDKYWVRHYGANGWTAWKTVYYEATSTYSSTGTQPVNGTAIAAAIGTLDVASVGGNGKYISAISEADGKISATATTMDTTPTDSSTKAVTSGGIKSFVDGKTFLGATAITSGNNLNDIYGDTTQKVRYCQWSSASAPTNAPNTDSTSIMEVKFIVDSSGKYSRQDVWTASGKHYWRRSTAGTWTVWTEQYEGGVTSSYSPTGTAAVNGTAVAAALGTLDATVTSTDGTNVQVKVTETDGKITAVNITTDNTENKSNKVTAWSSTTTDVHYPSEKLVKTALDGKKNVQTAKSDPTASGTGITYIATISQNTNGEITATKSTVRTATTSQTGVVQLSSSSSSTDESKAATPKGVWAAINTLDVADSAVSTKFVTAVSETNGKISVSRAQPVMSDVSGLVSALAGKEPTFTINYDATNNALVFSKTFGTV